MIKNTLKNGIRADDLRGHVLKQEALPELYKVLGRIQMKGGKDGERVYQGNRQGTAQRS